MSRWSTAVALTVLLAPSSRALALNPSLDVSQYVHTAWRIRDGFLADTISALSQTTDGYIWLGTERGLYRFDGIRAVAWRHQEQPRLAGRIVGLLGARDGGLWIGTEQGLVRVEDRQVTTHLAGRRILRIIEARDDTLWVTAWSRNNTRSGWGVCAIANGQERCYGDDGGPGVDSLGLYEDRTGTVWSGTQNGLWRWGPGPPTFYPLPFQVDGVQAFADSDDGALLVSLNGAIRRFVDGKVDEPYPQLASIQRSQTKRMLRDRDGSLWIGTAGAGLVHLHQGIADTFSERNGLSGNYVNAFLEDREGNIWVATVEGLDRFRDAAVAVVSAAQGLSSGAILSVHASRDGTVWLNMRDALNRISDSDVTVFRGAGARPAPEREANPTRPVREITVPGLPGDLLESVFEDSRGRLWVATFDGLGYLERNRFVRVRGLPGGFTRSMVEDADANVWIASDNRGLFHVSRTGEVVREPAAAPAEGLAISALGAHPSHKGVWIGRFQGGVTFLLDGDIRRTYTPADGLADGRVHSIRVGPDGTAWVAAVGGLSRISDGRVATVTSRNGLPCNDVHWTIEDDSGALWLEQSCGIVRIARSVLEAPITAALFDIADGVRTFAGFSYYGAPIARASDGRLWFMSPDGVSVIDPRRLSVNTIPPPVYVEQITADRNTYATGANGTGDLRLPPRTRDLQIEYTALSVAAPEKMRFRYMLEGRDSGWQDVGTRRQAFYTDLAPGRYRFRVIASNNSGVWNEAGAALDFSIAPAYYQTPWFLALSAVMVVGLVWTAHRVRLRIVEKHEREVSALNERLMKAQEQERIRIAGELHDGVMQQMLAVTMMLGTAKRRIPDELDAKAAIDKIQDKLIQVGTDIRQLSHGLHPPMLQDAGLPEAMRSYCDEFSASCGVPVSCEADDEARDLSRGTALALFRIVQEALGNAAKHARASRMTVRLTRSNGMVSLAVSDDGAGFDRSLLGTSGGLGLITMRERAGQLNGTFEFDSTPGRGTTIRVVVPFR